MNEQYLEWLFLREHLNYWIDNQFPEEEDVLSLFNRQYDVQKMKTRYVELTELLLKDYELDKEENK